MTTRDNLKLITLRAESKTAGKSYDECRCDVECFENYIYGRGDSTISSFHGQRVLSESWKNITDDIDNFAITLDPAFFYKYYLLYFYYLIYILIYY